PPPPRSTLFPYTTLFRSYMLSDDGSHGTMVAVGCETEPVSKSDEFQAYAEKVLRAVHADGIDAAATLEDERVELSAKLGENIARSEEHTSELQSPYDLVC